MGGKIMKTTVEAPGRAEIIVSREIHARKPEQVGVPYEQNQIGKTLRTRSHSHEHDAKRR